MLKLVSASSSVSAERIKDYFILFLFLQNYRLNTMFTKNKRKCCILDLLMSNARPGITVPVDVKSQVTYWCRMRLKKRPRESNDLTKTVSKMYPPLPPPGLSVCLSVHGASRPQKPYGLLGPGKNAMGQESPGSSPCSHSSVYLSVSDPLSLT